jgi:hypothetical protein
MSDIKMLLKIFKKVGYPNPNVKTIANTLDYDLDHFLPDLKEEIGEDGVIDFCDKAIEKLSGDKGIKIDYGGTHNEFVYMNIYPIYYDEDESQYDVVCNYSWGESKMYVENPETGNGEYKTIQEVISEADMGDASDLEDLLDSIRGDVYNVIYQNCGFGIWWNH